MRRGLVGLMVGEGRNKSLSGARDSGSEFSFIAVGIIVSKLTE